MKSKFNKSCYFTVQKEASDLNSENIKVSGMASTWNVDMIGDEMLKGCFEKSLKKSQGRYFVLANHNPDKVIGINKSAVETDQGLFVSFELFNTPENKKYITLVKKSMEYGLPLGLSIGGKIKDADLKKEGRGFQIKEFELLEHSITPIPCNQESRIESVKSFIREFQKKQNQHDNEVVDSILKRRNIWNKTV